MFIMTSDIQIGNNRVKASSIKYRNSVTSIVSTCSIELPRLLFLKTDLDHTETPGKRKEITIKEGDYVRVDLGYNFKNTKRFEGFVKRVSTSSPLVIDCEGYAYQINKITSFTKSYLSTTIKEILQDLTKGTDIVLHKSIPDVKVPAVRFKNATGMQVLEYIQKKLLLVVYFDFNVLYAGITYAYDKNNVKLKLGWNTVEDKELKQNYDSAGTLIQLVEKDDAGSVTKTPSNDTIKANIKAVDIVAYKNEPKADIREVIIYAGLESNIKKEIANRLQDDVNRLGWSGNITAFLEPVIEPAQVVEITDNRFPQRNASYLCESVDGSFNTGGGRQNVKLIFYAYAN